MKSFLGPEEVVGTGGQDRCWVPVAGHAREEVWFDQHSGLDRCTIHPLYNLPFASVWGQELGELRSGTGEKSGLFESSTSHTVQGHRVLTIVHVVLGFWGVSGKRGGAGARSSGRSPAWPCPALPWRASITHSAGGAGCRALV